MPHVTPRAPFLDDLRARIQMHIERVEAVYSELEDAELGWKPSPKEWSILECFDHLVLTFDYYRPKMAGALEHPVRLEAGSESGYAPSRWGRVYMYFALNPRYSFPTAAAITPGARPDRTVFTEYRMRQAELLQKLAALDGVDLTRTRIPVEKGVHFNLGDVLRILVYHDEVHFLQAQRVLEQIPTADRHTGSG